MTIIWRDWNFNSDAVTRAWTGRRRTDYSCLSAPITSRQMFKSDGGNSQICCRRNTNDSSHSSIRFVCQHNRFQMLRLDWEDKFSNLQEMDANNFVNTDVSLF